MEQVITTDLICLDVEAESKEDVIRLLAEKLDKAGRLNDKDEYIAEVFKREETYATGVGFSVATPHAKTDAVKTASVAFARLKKAIHWDDEDDVTMIFQLAVPCTGAGDLHLQILAALSRKLIYDEFRDQIAAAASAEEILALTGDQIGVQ